MLTRKDKTVFHSIKINTGELDLHLRHNARDPHNILADERPAIIFLHGFPEFWFAWEGVYQHFANDYLILAPDQRGYNYSDAPQQVENYKMGKLVGDIVSLAKQALGERKFILVGHDWGASVAYAMAIAKPEMVEKLIIANGVHPVCFQNALVDHPVQAQASSYMHLLKSDQAKEALSANNFERMLGIFNRFSQAEWLTPDLQEAYITAWSRPGRLNAMLNWYRCSPVVVPNGTNDASQSPLYKADREKFKIKMPHLLIWGMGDQGLTPYCMEGLENFAEDLRVVKLHDAGHWLLHSHAEEISATISNFI